MLLTLGVLAEAGKMNAQAMTIIDLWSRCRTCYEYTFAKNVWERQNCPRKAYTFVGWKTDSPQGTTGTSRKFIDWSIEKPCDISKHIQVEMFHNNLGNGS